MRGIISGLIMETQKDFWAPNMQTGEREGERVFGSHDRAGEKKRGGKGTKKGGERSKDNVKVNKGDF